MRKGTVTGEVKMIVKELGLDWFHAYSDDRVRNSIGVKLVNTYSVAKIMNGIIIILASENYTNIKSHKNIIEGRASSYRKFIGDVLLSY